MSATGNHVIDKMNEAAAAFVPCDCMEKFERMIIEKQPFTEFKGAKVLTAEFDRAFTFSMNENNIQHQPNLEIKLTIEGRSKPVRRAVIYNNCPFCGKPLKASKAKEEVPHA